MQVYCWVCCSTLKLLLYCVIIMFLTSCSLSASCVHVSAVLHYLVGLKGHHFMTPSQQETSDSENEDNQQPLPVTSFQCQWKQPRKRKESNLRISEVAFKKHQFGPQKRKRDTIEEFDPRPIHLRDTAPTNLLTFLSSVRNLEPKLGVSVLMDETLTSQYRVPEEDIPQQVEVLIKTLTLSEDERRSVESNTREQSQCREWHTSRKHRLTASNFGKVLTNSKPEGLVKQILYPQDISHIPAIVWGREKEAAAESTYTEYHRKNGNGGVIVSKIGFLVSETHPFLGASPDRCVYDPTSPNDPYGFLEIKCPYKHREVSPALACSDKDFCGFFDKSNIFHLKQSHKYYAQVQGQMVVGKRNWCDFVVWTTEGMLIERILYDATYMKVLLPKLVEFYKGCIAPEIVSPNIPVCKPVRDLR